MSFNEKRRLWRRLRVLNGEFKCLHYRLWNVRPKRGIHKSHEVIAELLPYQESQRGCDTVGKNLNLKSA